MDTVTLTIDGQPVTVEKGKTVLQAAIESGISVPYYCYHPGIGIDGSCRVCIVKIEKMPKLQTSCSTVCTEGMVVSTRTPEVVAARAGVFEFLLVNHPLDCPVCDKGGECPLQDFSYTFGPDQSRMEFPRRVFDGDGVKADVDFGPTLMLNRNRCILCTRCVRFMRDIDGDAQINIIDRGYGSEIATFQEEGVHSLISGNLMDVCPVGAITTRDYRFKSRPWDNPQRRRHHLHAVREGLQRHRVDQGQAGMGEGLAADPVHAAVQSGRQRLLDVRHRPLRVSLDRRRRSAAQAAGARTANGAAAAGRRGTTRRRSCATGSPPPARRIRTACASCCRRTRRTKSCSCSDALTEELMGDAGPRTITVSWRYREKPQPPRHEVQGAAGRRAERERRAHASAWCPARRATKSGEADSRALRAGGRGRPRDGAVRVRSRARKARSATSAGSSTRARAARCRCWSCRACCSPIWRAPPISCCPAHRTSRRKRPTPTSRAGCRRRRAPSRRRATRWKTGRFSSTSASALGVPFDYTSRRARPRRHRRALPEHAGARGLTTLAFSRPIEARHWLQASNPSERWKWDFMYPGSAAGQGRRSTRARCRCRRARFR